MKDCDLEIEHLKDNQRNKMSDMVGKLRIPV